MKRLLISGAGEFGREALSWALDLQGSQDSWRIGGFLDGNPSALDGFAVDFPILGDPKTYVPSDQDTLVCSIGMPRERLALCRELRERGSSFTTLIHPTVSVALGVQIGEGCILCPGSVISAHARLGDFVIVNINASVGHDVIIGPGCILNSHADVTGRVRLGEGVTLGSHAAVLPGLRVGDYAIVGAGSVAYRNVKPGQTVVGVPAKEILIQGKQEKDP